MVKRRVIPCLDVAEGRVVKGVNFRNLRADAGIVAGPSHCRILVRRLRVRDEALEGAEVRLLTEEKATGVNSSRWMGKSNSSHSNVEAIWISSPRSAK